MVLRPATQAEIAAWPFAKGLGKAQLRRLQRETTIRAYPASTAVMRRGEPATHWVAVVNGAVKIEVVSADGRATTLATLTHGSWFGEGSVLKQDPLGWPFDAVALVDTELALMPAPLFHWLLDTSLPFCRFVIDQLNARLAQFIDRCAHERLHSARQHIAHCINEFTDRQLYPENSGNLPLSQEGLARLAGVSRQVANRVLHELEAKGILRIAYGSIALVDTDGLRNFSGEARH